MFSYSLFGNRLKVKNNALDSDIAKEIIAVSENALTKRKSDYNHLPLNIRTSEPEYKMQFSNPDNRTLVLSPQGYYRYLLDTDSLLNNRVLSYLSLPDNWEVKSSRVMIYEPGAHLVEHVDSALPMEGMSNYSAIIPLSNPSNYSGGNLVFYGNKDISSILNPCDMLCFDYEQRHKITPLLSGIRFSLNFRINVVDK